MPEATQFSPESFKPIAPSAVTARNLILETVLNGNPEQPLPEISLQQRTADEIVAEFGDKVSARRAWPENRRCFVV
jgi:hypothetical protein